MIRFVLFIFITLAAGVAYSQVPGQPYASYWHPNDLLSWTPESDPDAPYNVSGIELSDRFIGDTQANIHARPDEAGIAALSIMYPSTSGNPSQGANIFDCYTFNYWQYTDVLVFWGGSAGEGLILAPNPGVITAGHRNGVPVYGTVFFPPVVYGGQIDWVLDFVQRDGDTFPVADKLIEVAEYYGFDGWFINQETAGGDSALAHDMRDLMEYIQINSDIRLMWYDAMIETGGIAWQNSLNINNDMFFEDGGVISNEMFLNFWWSANGLRLSAEYAENLGRSPYELYAGVDVQANGYYTSVNWDGVFPEGESHMTSLGFYCPNWSYSNSPTHEAFYERANRFWVGANRDPGNTETTSPWKGMAHYVPATSPIDTVPFVTNFNTGQGHFYAIEGEVCAEYDWSNRALQDILPTWRWVARSLGSVLYPELDWNDAFCGGSCLSVSGDLYPGTPTVLYLYKTAVELSVGDILTIAWKHGNIGDESSLEIGLAFDDPEVFTYFAVGSSSVEGWNETEIDLSSHAGDIVSVIALRFDAEQAQTDYEMKIGRLGIMQGNPETPAPPSGLIVDAFQQIDDNNGTIRLKWNHSPDSVYTYFVFRQNADSTRTFLGGTPNNAYFVPSVIREGEETSTIIEVVAVSPEFIYSTADTVSIDWTITGMEEAVSLFSFGILSSFPNPSEEATSIRYSLGHEENISMVVYSIDGRIVDTITDDVLHAGGEYTVNWTHPKMPSGIYFVKLTSGNLVDVRRVVICN